MLYRFDDVLDAVLNEKNDDVLHEKIREYASSMIAPYFAGVICMLCLKKRKFKTADLLLPHFQDCSIYVGLYSDETKEKTMRYIDDMYSYTFDASDYQTYVLIYHLMRNKCYDLIKKYLDMFEIVGWKNKIHAELMGIAIKLKDIDSLRLFLERGFCLAEEDIDYLKSFDEDYFNNVVMAELKKYDEERIKSFAFEFPFLR